MCFIKGCSRPSNFCLPLVMGGFSFLIVLFLFSRYEIWIVWAFVCFYLKVLMYHTFQTHTSCEPLNHCGSARGGKVSFSSCSHQGILRGGKESFSVLLNPSQIFQDFMRGRKDFSNCSFQDFRREFLLLPTIPQFCIHTWKPSVISSAT